MPFADEKGEGIVVVWTGMWMIHVIDHKLFARVSTAMQTFPKAPLPPGSMLQRFVGMSNIFQDNGNKWKRQSSHVQAAFAQPLPIDLFSSLARNALEIIEDASSESRNSFTVRWCDIAQKFTLDAVASSIIGHQFNSLRARSPFVDDYNQMMHDIAEPMYLAFPILERLLPRQKAIARMDRLHHKFQQLIDAKRSDPGDDVMTILLKDPEMSDTLLNNLAGLILAGHDTTTGVMSSLVYYLAVNRRVQSKVREEVLRVLGPTNDPSVALMSPQLLPYLNACLHEALRMNSPASVIVPRSSQVDFTLGKYHIPAGSQLLCNIYAVHHNKSVWHDPEIFRPERFLEGSTKERQPWIPFSVGPRQCPGQNFAQYEIRTLVAMLVRRYEWSLPEGSIHACGIKNAFSSFAVVLPKDLDITFKLLDGQQRQ